MRKYIIILFALSFLKISSPLWAQRELSPNEKEVLAKYPVFLVKGSFQEYNPAECIIERLSNPNYPYKTVVNDSETYDGTIEFICKENIIGNYYEKATPRLIPLPRSSKNPLFVAKAIDARIKIEHNHLGVLYRGVLRGYPPNEAGSYEQAFKSAREDLESKLRTILMNLFYSKEASKQRDLVRPKIVIRTVEPIPFGKLYLNQNRVTDRFRNGHVITYVSPGRNLVRLFDGKKLLWGKYVTVPDTGKIILTIPAFEPDTTIQIDHLEIRMVMVQGGMFVMGDLLGNNAPYKKAVKDCPAHFVTIDNFYISRTEVTNQEFLTFLNDYNSETVKSGPYSGERIIQMVDSSEMCIVQTDSGFVIKNWHFSRYPVINVSWFGAMEYTAWLSRKTGYKWRLPTETEWEYAARGGRKSYFEPGDTGFPYSGGYQLDEITQWEPRYIRDVGSKIENELGLVDMTGNVMEWCADYCDPTDSLLTDTYVDDLKNPLCVKGISRIIRGGSSFTHPFFLQVFARGYAAPMTYRKDLGFRVVMEMMQSD
ncbi:SUMF1/EgtB/PvdO family nonheme iron enzyme [bacterium]|nr:SUMF1/EgtB/PvdO family nonheme iron enzyme [bacterium]